MFRISCQVDQPNDRVCALPGGLVVVLDYAKDEPVRQKNKQKKILRQLNRRLH